MGKMSIIKKTVVYKKNHYEFLFSSKWEGDREKCLVTITKNNEIIDDYGEEIFLSYYGCQIGINDTMFDSISNDFIGEFLVYEYKPNYDDIDYEREKMLNRIKIREKILN